STTAVLLLYALQTAATNLRNTKLEPLFHETVVIDPGSVSDTGVGDNQWHSRDFEEEEEEGQEEEDGDGLEVEDDDDDGRPENNRDTLHVPPRSTTPGESQNSDPSVKPRAGLRNAPACHPAARKSRIPGRRVAHTIVGAPFNRASAKVGAICPSLARAGFLCRIRPRQRTTHCEQGERDETIARCDSCVGSGGLDDRTA